MSSEQKPPKGLGLAGRKFWRAIVDEFTLDARELQLLHEACRVVDRLELLDAALGGEVLEGGQPSAVLKEARQQQLVLSRLLGGLRFPDGAAKETASQLASRAALTRWNPNLYGKDKRRGA